MWSFKYNQKTLKMKNLTQVFIGFLTVKFKKMIFPTTFIGSNLKGGGGNIYKFRSLEFFTLFSCNK